MNLEDKIKLTKLRNGLVRAVLAVALGIGAIKAYLPLNLPAEDSAKPISTAEDSAKPIALVADDTKQTRDRVESYLRDKGYEVVQASTVGEAKEQIQKNSNIVKLVTDMDFAGSYDNASDIFKRKIAHRIDGFYLIKWLDKNQKNGKYRHVEQVTLHSTILNEGNLEGIFARPVTRYVVSSIGEMGDGEIRYNAQPKTAILGDGKK